MGLPNSGASGVSRHPSSAAANGSLTHSSQQSTTTRTPQNQHLRSQSNAADKCRSAPAADRQNNSRTNSTVESHRSNLPSSATKISRHQSFLVTGSQGGYQLHPHGISQVYAHTATDRFLQHLFSYLNLAGMLCGYSFEALEEFYLLKLPQFFEEKHVFIFSENVLVSNT